MKCKYWSGFLFDGGMDLAKDVNKILVEFVNNKFAVSYDCTIVIEFGLIETLLIKLGILGTPKAIVKMSIAEQMIGKKKFSRSFYSPASNCHRFVIFEYTFLWW